MNTAITALLEQAITSLTGKKPENITLETPQDKEHGDLSTNAAMQLSKELEKNPREVAQELIDAIPENTLIEKVEIAGPGFINFWLTEEVYEQSFEGLITKVDQKSLGQLDLGQKKKVVTESSHPNVAKPMGVHNSLSTIIGHAVNNLLKAYGYEVIRDNFLGDWGTQFGKLTYAVQAWGDMQQVEKDPIPELLKLYVQFHNEVEEDPSLEDKGRENFKKLEEGDEELKKLWEWIVEVSMSEFNKTYERLGVGFDIIHGESYYEDKMPAVLKEGQEKGVIVEGEGGSLIIPMDDENLPPCIVQKSDGSTTYGTRDLARLKDYEENLKADIGIVIVDIAQKLHHDQVNEAADKMGIGKEVESIRVHFGRMSFPEGGMSTRKGQIIAITDVLDEAEKRALQKIKDHNSELPEEEQVELARMIGIGAIKYNVLSQNRNKNYTFVWDQMLSFDGNSAPYLQYAYTRTQSILRKAPETAEASTDATPFEPDSKELLKKLLEFEPTIKRAAEEYKPNTLCNYLFELAQTFSTFYNNVRVIDPEQPAAMRRRLELVKAVAYSLKSGLEVLGIEVPERM